MSGQATAPERSSFSLGQRTYNAISYAGAAIVMLVFSPWEVQGGTLLASLWVLHFVRRTLESLFVHRYGGRVVPPADYLSEYLYYWGFAFWIARGLGAEDYEATSGLRFSGGLALFCIGQVGNAWAHLKLRNLRPSSGVPDKRLPEGGLFSLVACPHYLFEIVVWAGFALMANVWGATAFFVVATAILASYARTRHLAYLEEFDGKEGRPLYAPSRRALVPFLF